MSEAISSGPRISVGLPVRNGENYIQATIESILAQTFEDFELIISDNASTDKTAQICQDLARRDTRIVYVRSLENVGGAPNFNRTVTLARGEFFKWAAHDDTLAPTFLERCLEALETNPQAVLAHPWTQIIDAQSHWVKDYHYDGQLATASPKPSVRFGALIHPPHQCYQLFGLMRKSMLQQTPLHGSYGHADGVLLARLSLMGPFVEIPEHLFFARSHPEQTLYRFIWTQKRPDYRALTVWCDPRNAQRLITPKWTILREYWQAIAQANLSRGERRACDWETLRWARTYWKGLLRDLGLAAIYPFQKIIRAHWGTLKPEVASKSSKGTTRSSPGNKHSAPEPSGQDYPAAEQAI